MSMLFDNLVPAFYLVLSPTNILIMIAGIIVGTILGALPGFGAAQALALMFPFTLAMTPEAGALIPSLALGIPGSGAIAVLLGLLISKGIVPGPLLFTRDSLLVMSVFLGLIVSALLMLAVGMVGVRIFALFVLILLTVGIYAEQNYAPHIVIALALGAFAFWLEKIRVPVIPIVLAFVMGPIVEANLNRAMVIHGGDLSFFLTRPITIGLLVLAAATVILGFRRSRSSV